MTALHHNLSGNADWDEEDLTGNQNRVVFDEDSDTDTSWENSSLPSARGSTSSIESGREESFHGSISDGTPSSSSEASHSPISQPTSASRYSSVSLSERLQAQRLIGKIGPRLSQIDSDYSLFIVIRFSGLPNTGTNTIVCGEILAVTNSRVIKGKLISNPYHVKMAGSKRSQKLWPVQLEREIKTGDCGTWIVDAFNGDLYGHVVAGDSRGRAFITSVEEMFNNIAELSGARPSIVAPPAHGKNFEQQFRRMASSYGPGLKNGPQIPQNASGVQQTL
ncbi:MAG: hypothetical protein MMC33_008863 [Icmadophila ericetorum]|nr:hypothetical protein [Icmadophila ericetorum]